MKLKLIIVLVGIFLILLPRLYALDFSDTLYICSGESVQLQTTPNEYAYSWSPNENINNLEVHNPIVDPVTTTTYTVTVDPNPTNNLIYNGDFALGHTGFDSEYNFTPDGTTLQGFYGIFSTPSQFNTWFSDCADHSDSSDNLMLIVDGATELGKHVWCQQVGVAPNTNYEFSCWLTNIFWELPSLIQFSINGVPLGNNFQIDNQNCWWEEFSKNWFSGNNTFANICIESLNTDVNGNDFAIDDISLEFESQAYTDTFLVVVLENSFTQIDTSICANESVTISGFEIPAGSNDTIFETSFNGCDSLIFVTVNAIDTSYTESRLDTLCAGDTLYYLGIPIVSDTSICDIYTNYLGCDSSICFVVYFLSEHTIAVNKTSPSCFEDKNGALTVMPFAGLPPYEYLWNNGNTFPTIDNLAAGSYTITVTDANHCSAVKEIELTEPSPLSVDYNALAPSCFGATDGSVSLSISGGTPEYSLVIDDTPLFDNVFIEDLAGGNYLVLVEDNFGCFTEVEISINEPDPILIELPSQETVSLGEPFEISPEITSNNSYQLEWFPTVDLSCSICSNPITTSTENISYQITVEDNDGCIVIDSIDILVQNDFKLYIPNAFSPNGDGVNDYFELYPGKGVETIKTLKLFNRWGAVVFEKSDFFPDNRENQWDGTFRSEDSAPGVYTYLSKVLFINGDIKVFSGNILLIR